MNKLKSNFIFKLIYQLTAVLVPLIITPYLARVLGPTQIGNYGYTYSLVTYFGLVAVFGFNIYGRREIAKVREDKEKTSKTFFELMIAKSIPASLSIIGFILMAIFYKEYSILFYSMIPFILYHFIDITFLVQGDENFKFITIRDLLLKIISVVLIFIFVKKPSDVWIYALIMSLTTLVSGLAMIPYLRKRIVKISLKNLSIFVHLKNSVLFLVPAFAASVFLYVDKIMIKLITGSSEQVAFYEESIKIIMMLAGVMTSLANVIEPRNANEFANGNMDTVRYNTLKGINYSIFMCVPMAVGLFSIAHIFSPVFFGDGYEATIPVIRIMAFLIPIVSINEMLGSTFLIATGKEKTYSTIILICAGLNIALNIGFIFWLGAIGAAICTLVSELVKMVILFFYFSKNNSVVNILKTLVKKVISAAIMALFIVPVSLNARVSALSMILIIIIGTALYFASEYLLKDEEMFDLIRIIINMFKSLRKKKDA